MVSLTLSYLLLGRTLCLDFALSQKGASARKHQLLIWLQMPISQPRRQSNLRAGRTHDPESCFRRYASSGRDIEHALPGRKLHGAQQERKEVGRDMREGSVIFGGALRPVGKLIGHW